MNAPPQTRHGGEPKISPEDILALARSLRWEIGGDFHQTVMEAIYTDAANIACRMLVSSPGL